jgi:hypothetical protein
VKQTVWTRYGPRVSLRACAHAAQFARRHGILHALKQGRHHLSAYVCRYGTIRKPCSYMLSETDSCFGAGRAMTTLRVLALLYFVQAAVGVATGVAYAVWLLYW